MKKSIVIFLFILLILPGCFLKKSEPKCGDGVCDKIEKSKNLCPQDCAAKPEAPPSVTPPTQAPPSKTSSDTGQSPTLLLGLMVHLEGWDEEVVNRDQFEKHADSAKKLARVFEKYQAKVTFAVPNTWPSSTALTVAVPGVSAARGRA